MLYVKIFFLLACLTSVAVCSPKFTKKDVEKLRQKIAKAHDELDSNKFSPKLAKIIEKIPSSADSRGESALEFYACNACVAGVDEFLYMRREEQLNDTYLIELAIDLCSAFEIAKPDVCHGIVKQFAPSIIYIVDNRPELTPETACRFILNDGDCSNPNEDDTLNFSITIDEPHSREDEEQNELETPEILSINSSSTDDIIIVHLTDIHVDLKYKEGAVASCGKYACCRDTNEHDETNSSHLAGYWGDYRSCDTPFIAIEDAFHHIVEQHPKIDVVYFTGDIVDHFLWDATIDGMKESLSQVYGLMRDVFKDIPIYPILGNHESQNLFAPPSVTSPTLSTEWLYKHFIEFWGDKMTNDPIEISKRGGYYTNLIKPGLRVIALNNNLCYIYNFWVLYEVEQIREQYQWLYDTLSQAELAGEKVHILAHIPSGLDEYHEPCSREYQRIIERFKDTIVAQFNGHVETYGFQLYYEALNMSSPVSIAFNGGSLATFSKTNRNYVVYSVNSETFEVQEADVWTYNLTAANEKREKPQWYKQPSLREVFNLPDLKAATLSDFVKELTRNSTAFQQFWEMKVKHSDALVEAGCDSECFRFTICDMIVSDNTQNYSVCDDLSKD